MDVDDSEDACKDFGSFVFSFSSRYYPTALTGLVSSDESDKMDFSGASLVSFDLTKYNLTPGSRFRG